MDRFYRLVTLSAALDLDSELMRLADRVVVDDRTKAGLNWRDILATTTAVLGIDWQALLDLMWLQRPEQLSRATLRELFDKLEALGAQPVQPETLRYLAARLGMNEERTLAIAAQATSVAAARSLCDPSQLRSAFELLLLARHLGADAVQLQQLANLDDNTHAAPTANKLLQARVGEQAWLAVLQEIDDQLRQQRRDALVAYLTHGNDFRDVNHLYEHFLIDPQVEPCLITTRLLEAITATQLFAQRILFGLEPGISASKELKQRWTWMRNYRVWEANRKVFLFPENWLYPELRDDKSSSFKLLESALGQGELTQDLARQSFGQFLDDVAQMGQVQVLGMYEDVARDSNGIKRDSNNFPVHRTLYVIGRTLNQPYAYFWRQCVDFGSPYMEWSPWQRIELDIQGDHVLPFVLGGDLHIAWPLIRRIKNDSADDFWEVKLAWSRHDGKSWRKSSISRDFWSDKAAAFSDERRGFAFRCDVGSGRSEAKIFVYALMDSVDTATGIDPMPEDKTTDSVWDDSQKNPIYAADENAALEFIKALVSDRGNWNNLPEPTKYQMRIYAAIKLNWLKPGFAELDNMIKPIIDFGRSYVFQIPKKAIDRYEFLTGSLAPLPAHTLGDPSAYYCGRFVEEFLVAAQWDVDVSSQKDFEYFNYFYNTLKALSSRRIVICKAWIKLKAPDSVDTFSYLKLDGSEGTYSCLIDSHPIVFAPGVPTQMEWKLGKQLTVNCTLTLTLNETTSRSSTRITLSAPPGATYQLNDIAAGFEATQTVHFVIDGSKHNAIEIGFDLDARKNLNLVSEFTLTSDDFVSILSRPLGGRSVLENWVSSSQPWMNGFREIPSRQGSPLNIANLTIFNALDSAEFLAVGAATSGPQLDPPMTWHYSEGGMSRFVDLGKRAGLANSGLYVYPDSYKEATLRRIHWSEFQSLDELALQLSAFSANELPEVATGLRSTDWEKAKEGILAFDARMPYACYNWEVFFHAPLLIADQLSKQHKFEDAERWLRYVFDPTSGGPGSDAKRFLKFRVFKELDLRKQVIDDLTALAQVAGGFATETDTIAVQKLIDRWRDAPFRPFLIARRRHIAFLWRTLFAYLDNLIAWGDSLYRRDTRESINEATMLYVLAERILGRRPQRHEGSSKRTAFSYEDLAGKWDDFANYWIDVGIRSKARPYMVNDPNRLHNTVDDNDVKKQPSPNGMLYFCMPFNDKILSYWDIIEDRLFNVRHCRNIEGIERTLPLTDAPIDPELLVRAIAAGLDLGDVIAGLYAPPPHYRYNILSARAAELANEAKALGAAILSAIEKRDAEHLAQLRSSNEISLLHLVREVRTLQISETERNLDALRATRNSVSTRYSQYQRLLGKKAPKAPTEQEGVGEESMLGSVDGLASQHSNWGLIKEENEQYIGFVGANTWSLAAGIAKTTGGGFHAAAALLAPLPSETVTNASKVPNFLGQASTALGEAFSTISQVWRGYAEQQGMMAGHLRRRDEWAFQSNQTLKELQQIDKQILANDIRIQIARKELNNHIVQIEQAKAVDEVMRSKFSNEQLYQWMISQLSGLYFNAYRMALEMARRAERAAARELGVKPLNILRNDYWNSLREGLLAGERLHQDIKRLEVTYLDQNRRDYELTKHISLRRLAPEALVALRIKNSTAGNCSCEFDIPEWLFDLDTPGHYLRRIKSVSVSIPCVVGPYTSVNCKLTLLSSHVRHERTPRPQYGRSGAGYDSRFTDYFGASEAIVTSTANGDTGLFETQLRDERFLPFEGSGVISRWRLELPGEYPQFDYSTISDVVLSIRYTARDGGDTLRDAATQAITDQLTLPSTSTSKPLRFPVVLSCRSDFPTEWARAVTMGSALEIPITRDLLPYWMDAARVNGAKMLIHEVTYAKLEKEQTSPLDFVPANWPVNTNGVTLVNLGEPKVNGNVVADAIVLLSIGK